jgi:RNA-directed DNA polymerase
MESWSVHHLYKNAEDKIGKNGAISIKMYAQRLISRRLPVIFSLKHLSQITGIEYAILSNTVKRRREVANYRMFSVKKRSGGRRFIHAPSCELFKLQRFINQEILQKCIPHHASFAFHGPDGIQECAARHCGAKWLFQFDLKDFFYTINESSVFEIFHGLGYSNILSFELARLCTTTHLPITFSNTVLARPRHDASLPYPTLPNSRVLGVLPQGAPSSPMISNLAARSLDEKLELYANKVGLVYTRYADDICLSGYDLPASLSVGKIRSSILSIIRSCGFFENEDKIRIAGPGSRKLVLGLLVDGEHPKLSKEMRHRVKRLTHAIAKYGPSMVAAHEKEKFDSVFGFQNHVIGLFAFIKGIDKAFYQKQWNRLSQVIWLT